MTAKALQNLRLLFMRPEKNNDFSLVARDMLHKEFIEILYQMLHIFNIRHSAQVQSANQITNELSSSIIVIY